MDGGDRGFAESLAVAVGGFGGLDGRAWLAGTCVLRYRTTHQVMQPRSIIPEINADSKALNEADLRSF